MTLFLGISSLLISTQLYANTTEFDDLADKNHVKSEASVIINAPMEEVWKYNSINENAREWSVYFAKIVTCPISDCPQNATLEDSAIGFVRRAYRNDNETGIFWDEETLGVTKTSNKMTKAMRAYNFHGFILYNRAEHLVEQFYEAIDANTTKLTFRSRLYNRRKLSSWVSRVLYASWMGSGQIRGVRETTELFEKNLENIKAAIEQGEDYKRIHPYEPPPNPNDDSQGR